MGISNLRYALEKRYSVLSGQLNELRYNIGRIKREIEKLPEMEARIPELEALVEGAALVLLDANPDWRREDTPAIRPYTYYIPVPFGTCGRRGLEVLRQSERPMTVRQIALEVLRQSGNEDAELKVVQRTVNTIESSLRRHRGRTVESSGKYPAQWRTIHQQDREFGI